MKKHILIPLDVSENFLEVLPVALMLAGPGATIHLLNVIEVPTPTVAVYAPGVEYMTLWERLADTGRAHLNTMAEKVEAMGLAHEESLVYGSPADEILLRANEVHADLIVMMTHARRGLDRLLLGSTTEAVMRRAKCPVLTVRPAPAEQPVTGSGASSDEHPVGQQASLE